MAVDTGPIATEDQFPCRTLVACLFCPRGNARGPSPSFSQGLGRCFLLDYRLQSAEHDYCVYHECLVHPGALLHSERGPAEVLVGGPLGLVAVDLLLKHASVEEVVVVESDEVVHNMVRLAATPCRLCPLRLCAVH